MILDEKSLACGSDPLLPANERRHSGIAIIPKAVLRLNKRISNVAPFVFAIVKLRPCANQRLGSRMINHYQRPALMCLVALFTAGILMTTSGCFKQMAQLMYVIKGHEVPAKYQGLEEKTVAILCVSDQSAYGPDTLTYTISTHVGIKLASEGNNIKVVSPSIVEEYNDENGWSSQNVVALGQAVKADMVVVIEVGSYSIREGATLYKGRTDLTTTVYDVEKDGQIMFVQGPDEFSFPENGRPIMQTTERKFEAFFLARLTEHLARLFVPYDKLDSFAQDAMMN